MEIIERVDREQRHEGQHDQPDIHYFPARSVGRVSRKVTFQSGRRAEYVWWEGGDVAKFWLSGFDLKCNDPIDDLPSNKEVLAWIKAREGIIDGPGEYEDETGRVWAWAYRSRGDSYEYDKMFLKTAEHPELLAFWRSGASCNSAFSDRIIKKRGTKHEAP